MRIAGRLAAEVLEMIEPHVKAGVTTEELDRICHDYIVDVQKAIPAPLNYKGFPKSICTSINHVVCHGIPNDKPLKDGDILNIDITVIKDGYFGDTSKMFMIGKVPEWAERLCQVTQECLYKGISVVRPGATPGRHRRDHPEARREERLLGGARILRPRHRHRVPRGAAGAALRPRRHRPGTQGRHDLHHRADDQPGPRARPACSATAGPRSPRTASSPPSRSTPSLVTDDGYEILTLRSDDTLPRHLGP